MPNDFIGDFYRAVDSLQSQLIADDGTLSIAESNTDNIIVSQLTIRSTSKSIGHAFTVGHPVNGRVGTYNGIDGQQITIGITGLGASTLLSVTNNNNTFVEVLRRNDFVDTVLTTATVDTSSHKITFDTGATVFVSNSIAYGVGNITNATITIFSSAISGPTPILHLYLSNDGGATWTLASNGGTVTFSGAGTDLRYKITGTVGAILSVTDATGADSVITIAYNR